MARPNLRKTADLLEQVMTRGLQAEQMPKYIPNHQQMMMDAGGSFMELPLMEGQV